jgi:tripartite-type tricarboxylate transporter receptor subunit TctC
VFRVYTVAPGNVPKQHDVTISISNTRFTEWVSGGLLAPANTPVAVVDNISNALKAILEDPAMSKRMIDSGADPAFQGREAFGAFLKNEMPKWAKAVKDSGASVD